MSTVVRKVMVPVPFQGLCSPSQPRPQMPVECFTPHRHLQLVEGILHHVVCIQLVDLVDDRVHVAGHWVCEEQELGAGQCLEARQSELLRFEIFQT